MSFAAKYIGVINSRSSKKKVNFQKNPGSFEEDLNKIGFVHHY